MAFQGSREIELHQGGDGEGSGEGSGVALYTAAHSNKAQNTGAVEGDDLAGSKFCAHQDRRRERDGGQSAAAGEDTEHSIGDGPDIRGAGLHIGAVHLLKEGYQVIHSSLRGVLSCTAAGKYHGVDSVLIVLVIQEHGVDGKNGGQLFPHHLDSLVIELGQLQYCLAVSRGEALPLLFWREGRMSRYRRRCGRKEMKRAENDIR